MKRMCTPFRDGFLASHRNDTTSTSCCHTQLAPLLARLQKSQIKVEFLIAFVAQTEVFLIILDVIEQHTRVKLRYSCSKLLQEWLQQYPFEHIPGKKQGT
jgi:hypothetical protein